MSRLRQMLSKAQPFPGLRPFDYGDQDFFFGRRSQVASLYGLLDRSRFVAVIGSSGTGKSSLTRAGLLPILEQENKETRSGKWTWCSMRPGHAPLASLTDALANLADSRDGNGASDVRRHYIGHHLGKSSFGLADAVAEAGVGAEEKFVLVVDQFEELFRFSDPTSETAQDRLRDATSRSEARRFVELLMQGRRSTERDIRVLITMRSDFIGECADFPGLPEAVSATQFLVPGLELDQIEQIIVEPVKFAGAKIDPPVVQQLLTDAQGEPDQLPVLQHCLLQLWQQAGVVASSVSKDADVTPVNDASSRPVESGHAPVRCIDADCYTAVGKISGALSAHAEKVLRGFSEQAVEAVFRTLSDFKDGRAIRRGLPYAQLREECGVPDEELRKIVDRFRADDCSFLVTSPSGVEDILDDTVIDVGHEALLRRWERTRGSPGATGDVNDKKSIGWLAQEQLDGRKYQMLLSMLDGDRTTNKVEDIDRHWKWWRERPRTPKWAERYGGKYAGVQELLNKGLAYQRDARWLIVLVALGVGGLLALFGHREYRRSVETDEHETKLEIQQAVAKQNKIFADENFARSVSNAAMFLDQTLSALNAGNMKVVSAVEMVDAAQSAVKGIQTAEKLRAGDATFEPSPATLGLEVALHITATDILVRSKGSGFAGESATKAKLLADELVARQPDIDAWENLQYKSKFRLADALSGGNITTALSEYRGARDIAQKLANKARGDGERQYNLAFITVKIGEMLREDKKIEAARDQLWIGLEIAEKLSADHADKAEWQAYAPSTMSKIAAVLTQLPDPDLKGALALYDTALARQDVLAEKFRGNSVVLSNRISTRCDRAEALAQSGKLTESNAEFDRAIASREQLAEADRGNVTSLEYLARDYRRFARSLVEQLGRPDMADVSKPATDYEGLLTKAIAIAEKEVSVRQRLAEIDSSYPAWQKSLEQAGKAVEDLKSRLVALKTPPEPRKQ